MSARTFEILKWASIIGVLCGSGWVLGIAQWILGAVLLLICLGVFALYYSEDSDEEFKKIRRRVAKEGKKLSTLRFSLIMLVDVVVCTCIALKGLYVIATIYTIFIILYTLAIIKISRMEGGYDE